MSLTDSHVRVPLLALVVDHDRESRSDMPKHVAQPPSSDRVTRSEFDGLHCDTRAAFFAVRHEVESLRKECRTSLRRCAELQVDVDRLTKRLEDR